MTHARDVLFGLGRKNVFLSRPIRGVPNLSNKEPGDFEQCRVLFLVSEPQCRARGDGRPLSAESYCALERHQGEVHFRHFIPGIHPTNSWYLNALIRVSWVPLLPGLSLWTASLEHQAPTWSECPMCRSQRRHPLVIIQEDLRNVAGHGDHVDLQGWKIGCNPVDPAHPLGSWLVTGDVEHGRSGGHPHDLAIGVR